MAELFPATLYTHTQERKMFYKLNNVVDNNINFINAFIDLKVTGWKSYEKALNAYTNGFFSNQLENSTVIVEQTAKNMKKMMEGAKAYV